MFLDMTYYYKGSSNIRLELRQVGDYIDLITDYGEKITSLQTGYGPVSYTHLTKKECLAYSVQDTKHCKRHTDNKHHNKRHTYKTR